MTGSDGKRNGRRKTGVLVVMSICGVAIAALGVWRAGVQIGHPSTAARTAVKPAMPASPATIGETDDAASPAARREHSDYPPSGGVGSGDAGSSQVLDDHTLPIVCVDPGHPSEVNRGTALQHGLREVEVVYDVALKVKQLLENSDDPLARVVMTRDFRTGSGKIVTNRQRAEIANSARAALLIRLHCDTGKGSGYTIYFPDRQGKATDGKTGPSQQVIIDSRKAAQTFHAGMNEVLRDALTGLRDNGVKGDSVTYIGSKQGALTGSIYAEVPTLTIEMAFLSNPTDAKIIGSDDGQQLMAEALIFGVLRSLEAFGYRK